MSKAEDVLRPFLEGNGPNRDGEWAMFCPLHEDTRRSASANFMKGVWNCQGGCGGGPLGELIQYIEEFGAVNTMRGVKQNGTNGGGDADDLPSLGAVAGWASALQSESARLEELLEQKGLSNETVTRFQIGWDSGQSAYTIPIFDGDGEVVNIRRYQINPVDDRRKIWSVRGHGAPTLYPIGQLESDSILVCEGEWDALLTIQMGFSAITRTGTADSWRTEWNKLFRNKVVFVCHDMDEKGQKANLKVATELVRVAEEVSVISLPYPVTPKHGKDLSDFWLDGNEDTDFERLVEEAEIFEGERDDEPEDVDDIRLIETFSSEHLGKPKRIVVTVTGRKSNTYSIPEEISYSCTMEAGVKCAHCGMNKAGYEGSHDEFILSDDPVVLEMMDTNKENISAILRRRVKAPKGCPLLKIAVGQHHTVEEIFVRPDVDTSRMNYEPGDYQPRKVVSVGRHDTMPNSTVEIIGKTFPHPRDQVNTLLASEVRKTRTSLDNFEMTDQMMHRLTVFQTISNPLRKCVEIARELSRHVTHIYGRDEMHVLMDLLFHSALEFEFEGRIEKKGWLDVLILGDTRTGKSEAASRLVVHYDVGEIVSCESASFAGVVGGLEQHAGREWVVRWGAIPLNDRRAVVLDEVSGLSTEEISRMSSIRSSGVAELTKIQSERTLARTRLLWMGNDRRYRMSHYTYGVQGIKPLVGNNEDIARFDLAMTVSSGDVPTGVINRDYSDVTDEQVYTAELCHELILWIWSRRAHDVFWRPGTQDLIRDAAIDMGERYVDYPPLVQKENVRLKIARVAVAMAARTFSTDDGQNLVISWAHVDAAVQFFDRLYNMPGFGYGEISKEHLEDAKHAASQMEPARVLIHNADGLRKFLRTMSGGFKNQDVMDTMNMTRESAAGVTSQLFNMRMIKKEQDRWHITPALQEILREAE